MQVVETLKEIITSGLEQLGFAWWVEIVTDEPACTYYFGPFASGKEAELAQAGYVEDIEQEGAQGVSVQIRWCKPQELTVFEDQF